MYLEAAIRKPPLYEALLDVRHDVVLQHLDDDDDDENDDDGDDDVRHYVVLQHLQTQPSGGIW